MSHLFVMLLWCKKSLQLLLHHTVKTGIKTSSSSGSSMEGNCHRHQNSDLLQNKMSHDMTKPTKWECAQHRLRSAWASSRSDQSSLHTQWVAKDPMFLHADSEDSDHTGQMPRLIWVFAGHTAILLVLSYRGSNVVAFHLIGYIGLLW